MSQPVLIVPCCGESTRFPNLPPKYTLKHKSGISMLEYCLSAINLKEYDIIIIGLLKKHIQQYNIQLNDLISSLSYNEIDFCIIEQSKSQVDSVQQIIKSTQINSPFTIKDCDSRLSFNATKQNRVMVDVLNDNVNPYNKSYIQVNNKNITKIIEKQIISNLFSVGAYSFSNPHDFNKYYGIYISDIINQMIINGHQFTYKICSNYQDFGTIIEWEKENTYNSKGIK